MKIFSVLMMLCSFSVLALEKKDEVKSFNKVLLDDVQKDIAGENDFAFKKDQGPMRGPASVSEPMIPATKEEKKFDKQHRQLGPSTW
jgi:hypothetical protein